MSKNLEIKRGYRAKLRTYYHVLRIRKEAGALPPQFNACMDRFLSELRKLVPADRAAKLSRAA